MGSGGFNPNPNPEIEDADEAQPTNNPTNKPTQAPTKAAPSGGGNGDLAWDSGKCLVEHVGGCADSKCCEGLYCEVQSQYYSQCKRKNNAQCLVKDLACHNSNKKCCAGLKCVGNQWHAS